MIKNKYTKWLIIIVCIVFMIMSVTAVIMAGNTFHTSHCDADHCPMCTLIHISTDFIRNIELISFNILILIAIVPLKRLIEKNAKTATKPTLVDLKVVQIK